MKNQSKSNRLNRINQSLFRALSPFFAQNKAKQNEDEKYQQQPDINNTNKNQAIKEISIVLLVLL